ncbi:MAG: MBL fold metallo-hydrolase [Gemmatimonadota bacterium]
MTRLYVLGSGSGGNCIAIEHERQMLLIDAGFSAREIERRSAVVGLSLAGLVGIALTHEHGDHASGAARLAKQFAVPIVTAPGTWNRLAPRMPKAAHLAITSMGQVQLGPFGIEACATSHDAAEPLALVVTTADGARVGVAYDLGRPTAAVRFLLRELHALVIEANHDEILLRTSGYPPSVQERIAGSGGHLSNRAAAELIAEVLHPALGVIVLAHLSERCNSAEEARAAVMAILCTVTHACDLHVARQDAPLPPITVIVRAVAAVADPAA